MTVEPQVTPPPGWLTGLRHLVGVVVGALVVTVPMTPGLMPWVSAAFLPMVLTYALVIGTPAAFVMRWKNWAGLLPTLAAGAVVGAIPAGAFALLMSGPAGLVFCTLIGVAVAFVAWLVTHLQMLPDRFLRGPAVVTVGCATSLVIGATAVLGTHGALQAMQGPKDVSCHNPMRDGRRSIGPVASASLDIRGGDWARLRTVLAEAGRDGGWSVRDMSRSEAGSFRRVSVSLCVEPGTNVLADELVFEGQPSAIPGVGIMIYQPQSGESWIAPGRAVYRRVSVAWPGKLTFKDSGGRVVDAPAWYCEAPGDLPSDSVLCPRSHTRPKS